MGHGVVGRGGANRTPSGSCLLHVWSDGGEVGDEVVEGHGECGVRVADGEGNELHPFPVLPRAAMRGGVFFGLLLDLNVSAEAFPEAYLDEDEGTMCLVKHGRV